MKEKKMGGINKKDWFKEDIEYTPEVVQKLRERCMQSKLGYITTGGLIEFDKAIRKMLRDEYEKENN